MKMKFFKNKKETNESELILMEKETKLKWAEAFH